jgi:hypothetical protein
MPQALRERARDRSFAASRMELRCTTSRSEREAADHPPPSIGCRRRRRGPLLLRRQESGARALPRRHPSPYRATPALAAAIRALMLLMNRPDDLDLGSRKKSICYIAELHILKIADRHEYQTPAHRLTNWSFECPWDVRIAHAPLRILMLLPTLRAGLRDVPPRQKPRAQRSRGFSSANAISAEYLSDQYLATTGPPKR